MLQNKENNTELVNAKNRLENAVNDTDPTHGMTQETINNYNAKKREAQNEIQKANMIINNGDATAQDISSEKSKVEQVLQALQNAKNDLRADKENYRLHTINLYKMLIPMVKNHLVFKTISLQDEISKTNIIPLKMKHIMFLKIQTLL